MCSNASSVGLLCKLGLLLLLFDSFIAMRRFFAGSKLHLGTISEVLFINTRFLLRKIHTLLSVSLDSNCRTFSQQKTSSQCSLTGLISGRDFMSAFIS